MPRGKKALTNSALIKRKFEEPSMEEYELHPPHSYVEEPQNTKRKLTNSTEIVIASKENPIIISEEEGLKDMTCPVCNILIKNADDNIMDKHIDYCLSSAILEEEERLQQVQEKPIPKIPKKVERIMEDEMDEMGEMGIEIPREEEKEEEEESEHIVCPICDYVYVGYSCPLCALNNKKKKKPAPKRKPVTKRWQSATKNSIYITCAYPSCALNSELFLKNNYSLHVIAKHATEAYQGLVCPICPQSEYQVHPGTNLCQHIMEFHTDGGSEKIPAHNEVNFAEEILQRDLDQECSICFEPFVKGACIARLKCFCIFHKHCHQECTKHNKLHSQTGCPLHECLDPE